MGHASNGDRGGQLPCTLPVAEADVSQFSLSTVVIFGYGNAIIHRTHGFFFSLLQLPSYPEISIGRDALHLHPGTYAGYGRDDNRQILVRPANETIVKRLTRTLFEDGFLQALNEAHEAPEANPILRSIAGYIKRLFDATAQVNTYFCPYFRYERNVASVSKMFETRWVTT